MFIEGRKLANRTFANNPCQYTCTQHSAQGGHITSSLNRPEPWYNERRLQEIHMERVCRENNCILQKHHDRQGKAEVSPDLVGRPENRAQMGAWFSPGREGS